MDSTMDITFGKNILDSFTTGMYSDSKVIYREYIQNACDSIDNAVKSGIIDRENADIQVNIDARKRTVSITDHGTGIPKKDFFKTLIGNVANSDKTRGVDKGFRGIGRLCGLAYCDKLYFISSVKGENAKSVMTFDGKLMRDMLNDTEKYTVNFIFEKIVTVEEMPEDDDKHYFQVVLEHIIQSNEDLLDKKTVKDYLSFIAPVQIKNTFKFRDKIEQFAISNGYKIDLYNIMINGDSIFKEYTHKIYDKTGNIPVDTIFDVEFKEIKDNDGNVLAWLWYGLCRFEKSINKKANPMYGLRVRVGNIQIGGADTVADLFKEDRGNSYFVGEIHIVSNFLVPNAQRDNFNENEVRKVFRDNLSYFFATELHTLYNKASKTRGMYKDITEYEKLNLKYQQKAAQGFIDDDEKLRLERELKDAEQQKKESAAKLKNIEDNNRVDLFPSPLVRVQQEIQKDAESQLRKERKRERELLPPKPINIDPDTSKGKQVKQQKKDSYFTSKLSKLSRDQRKLVQNIMVMLQNVATPDVVAKMQVAIEKEYK